MSIPRGAKRGLYLRKSPKWSPKKWRPIYDKMVLLQVSGLSNKDIASTLGYTDQQVANILNTKEAEVFRLKISEAVNEKVLESIDAKIKRITVQSIDNVEAVIFNKDILEKAPLAMLDRSVNFLKAVGKLRGDVNDNRIQNNIIIGKDVEKSLLEGLERANRVAERHQIPSKTGV